MSRSFGRLLNLIIPGAGLVPIRREWLGLSLALLFAVCVNIWIAGQWIAPLAVPHWLSLLALALGILGWISAQALLIHHTRRHEAIQKEVDSLVAQARRDVLRGEIDSAHAALEAAGALDSERADVLAAEADLRESQGDSEMALQLRKRILHVAPGSEWALAAQKLLSRPPSSASETVGP